MLVLSPLSVKKTRALVELIQPDLLVDGHKPEERIVLSGISWERYVTMDRSLGDDRPGPRLYYLEGELEVMSTSEEHERITKWLGDFLTLYFDHLDIEIITRRQATMRLTHERVAAEPDDSWCLHEKKQFPDLVLEIALTSGGIRKLGIYQRFGVPEVWFWRRGGLEVHALLADGSGYERVMASRLLPGLDLALLERCVVMSSYRQARHVFRAGLATGK